MTKNNKMKRKNKILKTVTSEPKWGILKYLSAERRALKYE